MDRAIIAFLLATFALMPFQGVASADTLSTGWLAPGDPEFRSNELPQDYEVPYSYNYNTDCDTRHFEVITREATKLSTYPYYELPEQRHISSCAVQTPRGMHDGVYLNAGVPAGRLSGFGGFLAMIPNSSTLMSIGTGATNLDVSVSFYRALVPSYNTTTGEVRYDMAGHQYLTDRSGKRMYARAGSMGYSSDGKWMVIELTTGFARVNLQTKEIVPFATGLTYGKGTGQLPRVAISPDGRYAAVATLNTLFKVFDLSTCAATPDVIIGPVACQYKDIEPFLSTRFNTYNTSYYIRFASSDLLTFVTSYTQNGQAKRASVRMAPSGQPIEDVSYLALGDSFSSGEGAYNYDPLTDIPKSGDGPLRRGNMCHLSTLSYPYLTAHILGIDEGFSRSVACSGAKSSDYFEDKQYDNISNFAWLAGESEQRVFVREAKPNVVTISMIGNDIGFSNKIIRCIAWSDSCFHFREDRESIAREIYSKFDTLVDLYESIQEDSENAKVYVLGYPQIIATGECGRNVSLDLEERHMARGMVTYLNAIIKAATAKAGVQYIDVEDAFEGHQLCGPGVKAANGLTAGDDKILKFLGPIGNESFHPNKLGHELMSAALIDQSENFTKPMRTFSDPGQTVDPAVVAPYVGSDSYNALVGFAPSGGSVTRATYTTFSGLDLILIDVPFVPQPTEETLKPDSTFDVWIHSTPVKIGTLTTDEQGELMGQVTVPAELSPGYHTLHVYGQNLAGKEIDLYKTIYVAASEADIDGDGIPNSQEKCLAVEPTNVDEDRDNIDDACDAEITELPADTIAPEVIGAPDREPNENGWYNSDVTINWTATDPDPSSGVPTQPLATSANQEGVHMYTSDPSCDPIGNCSQGNLEIKIDKITPDITYTLNPSPTAAGWNNSEVVVTFSCTDTISGIAECTEPQSVTGQDGAYAVTGYVTDKAGNTNAVNVFVSLDRTNPTVVQSVYPVANAAGWHNADVTVTSVCDDNLSGVLVCSPSATLSVEGANQVVVSNAVDGAGNVATARTFISIDKTPPVLGAAAWSNNPKSVIGTATITVPAVDSLSGIVEAEYYLGDTDPGIGNGATMQVYDGTISVGFNADFPTGVYKVTMRAKDKAGNWSTPVSDYLVVYDPFGTRMTGKRTVLPSLTSGNILPGLISIDQTDKAKFGFNVRYDKDGQIHKHSDFQFKYETGEKCAKPAQAVNCHIFELNATSIAWLTTQGNNDSAGIFQGSATLRVDSVSNNVVFRLTGLDGERLNATSEDRLTLKIYAENTDLNSAQPLYSVDAAVQRGNIKIHK